MGQLIQTDRRATLTEITNHPLITTKVCSICEASTPISHKSPSTPRGNISYQYGST